MLTDAHSFDVSPNLQFFDSIATYVYCMYPQFTNHIWSKSHSGSNLEGDYEDDYAARSLPFFNAMDHSLTVWGVFMAGDDNGGYTSNQVVQWSTNIMAGPGEVWNGTGKTNEGISTATVKWLPIGGPQEDSATGGGAAQIARNSAATNLAGLNGVPMIDLWNCLWTNGVHQDITTTRYFGFYPGNHPYPAGYLCMGLWTVIMLGGETNIGSAAIDFSSGAVLSTNKMVVSGVTVSGSSLSFTLHCDRMPGAWDVGARTNGCDDAFKLMPGLASRFQWPIQITNLPAGDYVVNIDGSNVVRQTSTQLAAGWNMFAVTNGALWNQRKAVLNAKRDQEGVNHTTLLQTHTAGDKGVGNNNDLINYFSSATTYDAGTFRGSAYITAMAPLVGGMKALDVAIHDAAQQTNHTFTISPVPQRIVLFHK
jgi:hypothetical protein